MRCTACSERVKPVVALDIDGTLGDYHLHFLRFASLYLGHHSGYLDAKNYNGEDALSNWVMDKTGCDYRTWQDIKLAYRQGAQKRTMRCIQGARDLAEACRGAGAEVWLTTTRPYLRLDNVDPDTRFWLQRYDIPYDGLLYDEDKYAVLAERVDPERVVAVLDDLPEMYASAAQCFGPHVPILAGSRYNLVYLRDGSHTFVSNLMEARFMITKRLEERWED